MNRVNPPERWRFRLKLLTGIAAFVLVVVVLSASSSRREAERRRATLMATLRQLVGRQAEFHDRNGRYARLDEVGLEFTVTPGVVLRVHIAERDRWSAVATDPLLTVAPATCGVFGGAASASPHRAVIHPAIPECW